MRDSLTITGTRPWTFPVTGPLLRGLLHDVARGQSPPEDVVQTVDENDAELVVIGIRRRTAVGKLVLGSNATEILMRAPCPVLAVKPSS